MTHLGPTGGARCLYATVTVAAILAGATLSACSSASKSGGSASGARGAVEAAISAVGQESSARFTLSVPATTAQAEQLSRGTGGDGLSPAEAQALTSGSVFVTVQTGHGEAMDSARAASDPANAVDIGLAFSSGTPLELRYTGQNLYLRVEISDLLADVGQSPAAASKLESEAAQLNNYVGGLSALVQGQWVEVSQQNLQSLGPILNQLGSNQPGSQGSASASDPAQLKTQILQLKDEILAAVGSNSTFASAGASGGRDEYTITADLHGLAAQIGPDLQKALAGVPGASSAASGIGHAASSIPAGQKAVIDVYVSGGKLSEADLDLAQFSSGTQKPASPVPLRFSVGPGQTVSAPSGAVQLDFSKLPGLLQNLLSPHNSGVTS